MNKLNIIRSVSVSVDFRDMSATEHNTDPLQILQNFNQIIP